MASEAQLSVRSGYYLGVDVGGTKIATLSSLSDSVQTTPTAEHASVQDVLDPMFEDIGALPVSMCIDMAGPRDDETGEISPTNADWAIFDPLEAAERYPGTSISTANDMHATVAGVLSEPPEALHELKAGSPKSKGNKLVVALSTGLGVGAAIWDDRANGFTYMAGEGGHASFQPRTETEADYLTYLQQENPHVSAELALAGKYGIANFLNFSLGEAAQAGALAGAIEAAVLSDSPVGEVLLNFAQGADVPGYDADLARRILDQYAAMVGAHLRSYAMTFKATGGIFLTGSVAIGLAEYLASLKPFTDRFISEGAVHAGMAAKIPIYLVTDTDVAVKGALALAKGE